MTKRWQGVGRFALVTLLGLSFLNVLGLVSSWAMAFDDGNFLKVVLWLLSCLVCVGAWWAVLSFGGRRTSAGG